MPTWPSKYPEEDKSYGVDWTSQLGDRTITASDFTVRHGSVTIHAKNLTGAVAKVLVRGGIAGESIEIVNSITLDDGQDWIEPCYLKVTDD